MHHLEDSVSLAMEGDLLIIKPGMWHRYTGTRECRIFNCIFDVGAFEENILQTLLALPGLARMLVPTEEPFPHIHLDMMERKHIGDMLGLMERECELKQTGWSLKVQSLLYELLVECSRIYTIHGGIQSEKDVYSGHVTDALRYIEDHYGEEDLSVRELGEHVGVSPDYLSRQFRKMTGIAVQEYVRRYRLSRAIVSLQQGCSVSEAARKNGFHSIGYFSREFKKEMGVAPSHYDNQ